jgi:hypothetical protein
MCAAVYPRRGRNRGGDGPACALFRGWAERYRELLRLSLGLAMAFSRIPHEVLPHDGGRRVAPAFSGELVALGRASLAGASWGARR